MPDSHDCDTLFGGGDHTMLLQWQTGVMPPGTTFNIYQDGTTLVAEGIPCHLYEAVEPTELPVYYGVTAVSPYGESTPSETLCVGCPSEQANDPPDKPQGLARTTQTTPPEHTIQRSTYHFAGQAIALRVTDSEAGTTFYYLYQDHLGSATVLSNLAGNQVDDTTRYLPFGGYRTPPTTDLTELGYTSHRHNDDLGLIYMNARYYLPEVGRFISADTIVPNPTNAQSFNRYTYVKNNPLRFTDPTGHCSKEYEGENYNYDECVQIATYLSEHYGYPLEEMMKFEWNYGGSLPEHSFWHDPYNQTNDNFGYHQLIFENDNGLLAIQEKGVDVFEIWALYENGTKTGLVRNEGGLLDNFLGYADEHADAQTDWNIGLFALGAETIIIGMGIAEVIGGGAVSATGVGTILGIPWFTKGAIEIGVGVVAMGTTISSMRDAGRTIYNTSIYMEMELNMIWPSENVLTVSTTG